MAVKKVGSGTTASVARTERIALVDTSAEEVFLRVPIGPGATGAASLDGLAISYSRAKYSRLLIEWRPLIFSESQSTAAVALALDENGSAVTDFTSASGYSMGASGPVYKALRCSASSGALSGILLVPGVRTVAEPGFVLAISNPGRTRVVGHLWLTYSAHLSGRVPTALKYSCIAQVTDIGDVVVEEMPGNTVHLPLRASHKALPDLVVDAPNEVVGRNFELVPVSSGEPLPAVHAEHLQDDPDVRVTAFDTYESGGIRLIKRLAFAFLKAGARVLLRRLLPGLRPVVAALNAVGTSPPPAIMDGPVQLRSVPEEELAKIYDHIGETILQNFGFWCETCLTRGDTAGWNSNLYGGLPGVTIQTFSCPSYPGPTSMTPPTGTWWKRVAFTKADPATAGNFYLVTSSGRGAIAAPWGGYNYGTIASPKYSGRTGVMPIACWQAPLTGASADGLSVGQFYLIVQMVDPIAATKKIPILSGDSVVEIDNGFVFLSFSKLSADDTGYSLTVKQLSKQEVLCYLAVVFEGGFQSKYCMFYDGDYNPWTMPSWYTSGKPDVYSDTWLQTLPGGVGVGSKYMPMKPGQYAALPCAAPAPVKGDR